MRLFISYHSRDRVSVNNLVKALRERVGPGDEIFYDAHSLRGGSCWPEVLADQIAEAEAFVLLIAENGVGSWQILEYFEAFDHWVANRKPLLIPVLKEGQSAPGLPFLKHVHWIVEPDVASERCVGRILDAIRTPVVGALTEPWRHTRPYRGLLAMSEADCDFFFGRTSEMEQVLRVLQNPAGRLPILIGNSGVGKTSIAQAGVLAALKRQTWPIEPGRNVWPSVFQASRRWAVLTIRPGRLPLRALVEAFWSLWRFSEVDPDRESLQAKWIQRLYEGTASLKGLLDATQERLTNCGEDTPPAFLIYLDQGEELYARADVNQARRFTAVLAEGVADPRLYAFASIRSDFYGQLQADSALRSIWEKVDVHPLDRKTILHVITMPAQILGASFAEPALPGELARQTAEHMGYLPLLSYLLDDMWEAMQKRGDGLLLPGIGTVNVGGVLAAAGDRFIHEYPEDVPALRRIFTLKLAHIEEHGDPMRRRAFRSEFTDEEWRLVTKLADHPWRLLLTGHMESLGSEPFAEVGHEALLREWGELRDWLTGEQGQRNFLVWKTALERLRLRYEGLDEAAKENALLHGYDLQQARAWKEVRATDIPAVDLAYIDVSIRADDVQKLRVLQQLRDSRATQSRFLADLSSQRLEEGKVDEALAFALEAAPLHIPDWPIVTEAENALFSAVHAYSVARVKPIVTFVGHEGTVQGAIYTADDSRVLTWSYDGTARIWDAATGDVLHVLRHDGHLMGAAFSANGERVLSWSGDGTARLWDTESGQQFASLLHEDEVKHARFYADESAILSWSIDGTARLWDVATGGEVATLRHESRVMGTALTKDETRVLTWSFDGTARLWDAKSGQQITLFRHEQMVRRALFSADERTLLTCSADGTACMWDAESGQQRAAMRHDDGVLGAAFSENESHILTWSADGTARVWDSSDGREVALVRHEERDVLGALFSKDESRVLTWSSDNTARLWSVSDGKQLARMDHADLVLGALFSPDESCILTWSVDQTARIWPAPGQPGGSIVLRHDAAVRGAVFSVTGYWVWTLSDDGTVRLWIAAYGHGVGGRQSAMLRHDGEVLDFSNSSQGGTILTTSTDGSARLWDTTGNNRFVSLEHEAPLMGARISKDSKRVLSWSADGVVVLQDPASGESLVSNRHGESISGASVSPQESKLTTWSDDGLVCLWDSASGARLFERRHAERVMGALISTDDTRLLTWAADQTAKLWDASDGTELLSLPHESGVAGAALSKDGRRLVTWSNDGAAYVRDAATGSLSCSVSYGAPISGAAFSGRADELMLWSSDGTVRMWDCVEGIERRSMRHKNSVVGALFTHEGDRVLTFSADGTARIWDAITGEQKALLHHDAYVEGAILSHDESQVLSWSRDGTARLWDAWTGRERVKLRHEHSVSSATFSSDGRRILTWSRGAAEIWDGSRGDKLATFAYGGWDGEARLAEDQRWLLTLPSGSKSAALWPLLWSPSELVERANALTKWLRPLSKVDRCQAYLDTEGCYQLGGASERDLALAGNVIPRKGAPGGVGNLTDFVVGVPLEGHLDIEIAINNSAKVILYHSLPIPNLCRFRYHRATRSFEFIRKDGEIRNSGLPLVGALAVHLPRADRVLMVLTDPRTGEAEEGDLLPMDVY